MSKQLEELLLPLAQSPQPQALNKSLDLKTKDIGQLPTCAFDLDCVGSFAKTQLFPPAFCRNLIFS